MKQRGEMVRLWNHLMQLPADRLTKKIFKWDRAHSYPWTSEVAAILSFSDLHFIFRNSLQCNINTVKQKLLKTYKEQQKDICRKPKLKNYIEIKDDYRIEPYVKLNLQRGQRFLCAQLRTGTSPLAVEVGK